MMFQILDGCECAQKCVARALYDNVAEAPDELPFKKGDLLFVLEQNTAGLEGWWLCCLKGRQGICPGNRLRLLAGAGDSGLKANDVCPTNTLQRNVNDLCLEEFSGKESAYCYRYDVPSSVLSITNTKYGSIRQDGEACIYGTSYGCELNKDCHRYDAPMLPFAKIENNDSKSYYDVPKPIASLATISPSSSTSSLVNSYCDSICSSNWSSLAADYDVPMPKPVSISLSCSRDLRERSQIVPYEYDEPPHFAVRRSARELPLELTSAVENLEKFQNEITAAIDDLLSYAAPGWREMNKLQPKLMDIKSAALRLRSALHDLSEFSDGVLGNAMNASNKDLARKLSPITKTLLDTDKVVQECTKCLENCRWSADVLVKNACSRDAYDIDALDQLVVCARSLTEDVRQFASFVQGNASLLFKRNSTDNRSFVTDESNEDADYVNFESHKTLKQTSCEVSRMLSRDMQKSFDLLVKRAENGAALRNGHLCTQLSLDQNDKQVLSFYASLCATHSVHLKHAIDAFLSTVERNQPPKVFLAHGKFVVLSAHRLIHIGDIIHQNVSSFQISTKVLQLSDSLSDGLAAAVHKIKKAAVQFPSVNAVQQMVDAVIQVSHFAGELKIFISSASHLGRELETSCVA